MATVTDKTIAEGMRLARGIFALRGNHSEIHLSETELASQLTLAFQHGIRAAIRELHGMLESEGSLLHKAGDKPPEGCYCQPGQCAAPIIMGRQMPCRDPEKAKIECVKCLKCSELIPYKAGTCPHCGYVEFKG